MSNIQKVNTEHFKQMFKNINSAIVNGELPALEYVKAIKIGKLVDIITKDKKVREMALEEAARYPEGQGSYEGLEWTYKKGSGKYDYSVDHEYAALKEQRDKLDDLIKERQELLKQSYKMAQRGDELVVNGELIPVPKFIPYSDSISVK